MTVKKTLEEVISEAGRTSNEIIPKHIKIDVSDEEHKENKSLEKEPDNILIDRFDTKADLKKIVSKSKDLPFSKWNIFKRKAINKINVSMGRKRTIRVMVKSDYTIYPIDLEIDGKTVYYKGRRFKLDGYEHRIYELQGLPCLFVDVNDARPIELSHQYTNVAYDAREFCALFDAKAIQDLMSGINQSEQLNKMLLLSIVTLCATLLAVGILWGTIQPDWQKNLDIAVALAKAAMQQVAPIVGSGVMPMPETPAQVITGG